MVNVVIIKCDDLGVELLSCYDALNQSMGLNTNGANPWPYPSIPAILTEVGRGVVADEAYAQPVCSSSRVTMQYGRYPANTGVGNIVRPEFRNIAGFNTAVRALDGRKELSLGEACKLAGLPPVSSAMMGKNHVNNYPQEHDIGHRLITEQWQYDVWRGVQRNLNTQTSLNNSGLTSTGGLNPGYWFYQWVDSLADARGGVPELVNDQYITTRQRNQFNGWINNFAVEPFFGLLALSAPHNPLGLATGSPYSGLTPGLTQGAIDAATNSAPGTYPIASCSNDFISSLAAVEALDKQIASIVGALTTQGYYSNTVIVIMGDNGTPANVIQEAIALGEDVQDPLLSVASSGLMKGSIFRQGGRMPMIVSGPSPYVGGTLGRHSSSRIDIPDVHAFVLDVLGRSSEAAAEVSSRGKLPIDGISFAPIIANESNEAAHPRDFNYFELFTPNGDPYRLSSSVAGDRWDRSIAMEVGGTEYSLLRFLNGSELFYDRDADPLERSPIAPTAATDTLRDAMFAIGNRAAQGLGPYTSAAGQLGGQQVMEGSIG